MILQWILIMWNDLHTPFWPLRGLFLYIFLFVISKPCFQFMESIGLSSSYVNPKLVWLSVLKVTFFPATRKLF